MPKVDVSSNLGLVQQTGSGIVINNGMSFTPVAAIADGEGQATAAITISADATIILVTNETNGNDRLYLPAPADVPAGKIYYLVASEAFELCSRGDGTNITTINGTNVTNGAGAFAAELDINAGTVMMCIRDSATSWRVVTLAAGGTPD